MRRCRGSQREGRVGGAAGPPQTLVPKAVRFCTGPSAGRGRLRGPYPTRLPFAEPMPKARKRRATARGGEGVRLTSTWTSGAAWPKLPCTRR